MTGHDPARAAEVSTLLPAPLDRRVTAPTPEAFRTALRALRVPAPGAPVAVLPGEPLPVRAGRRREPWDAVLVVDDSPSMRMWSSAVRGVERSLRGSGVFRNVVVRRLRPGSHGPSLSGSGSADLGRCEIPGSPRRRAVLVLTDCAHSMWLSGLMWAPLRMWGSTRPVVIASVVSWSVASRSGLVVHRLRLRARRPGAATQALEWRPRVDPPGVYDEMSNVMPVCFTELDLVGLRRWADLTGRAAGWADTGAILVPEVPPESRRQAIPSPAELVSAFRAHTSPDAFRLAVYLAAVPLELELMAQVGRRLLPETSQAALAEFLCSPLIEPRDETAADTDPSFQFTMAGLRNELLGFGRRSETEYVRELVRRHLARHGRRFDQPVPDTTQGAVPPDLAGRYPLSDPESADERGLVGYRSEPRWPSTAVHRAIIAVDVESYGDPARTSYHRMAARAGIREVMATACAEAGVPGDLTDVSDTGDGLLVLVHPEVSKVVLVDILPARIAAAVRRHNAVHAPEARFRLRMAVNAGEIHYDGTGRVGQDLILTYRILDAAGVRDALKQSTATVVLAVSDQIHESVVRQDPGIDPVAFRPTVATMKETRAQIWVRLVDGHELAQA